MGSGMVRAQQAHVANGPCDALLARVDGDFAIFDELCDLFLEDAPKRIEQLRRAIETEDARGVQAAAHAFKGAAGVFEADDVVAAARQLEHQAGAGDLRDAASRFANLEKLSAVLIETIRATRTAVSCKS
jgi:HPt (histidine-containing phosphotransfer) domain-containing protein